MLDKLKPFVEKYNEINEKLASPEIASNVKEMTKLSREAKSLEPLVEKAKEYEELVTTIEEAKSMLDDPEMAELAKEELKEAEEKLPALEEEIKILMLPKDPNDDKNIYLEIRAGTGGDEAALFVADLFRAYVRYAEKKAILKRTLNLKQIKK